jgi:hypothetical protein
MHSSSISPNLSADAGNYTHTKTLYLAEKAAATTTLAYLSPPALFLLTMKGELNRKRESDGNYNEKELAGAYILYSIVLKRTNH